MCHAKGTAAPFPQDDHDQTKESELAMSRTIESSVLPIVVIVVLKLR